MTANRLKKGPGTTRARIAEAATKLFFSRGYNDVRIAEIAAAAHSNIASVNYHFGSKESLFADIFTAECEKVATARSDRLEALLRANTAPMLEDVVRAWLDPVFENHAITENRIIFTHLMGLVLWSDVNDKIRETMSKSLAVVDQRYIEVLAQIRPDLSRDVIAWRMFGALGAYSLTLGHPELIDQLFAGATSSKHATDRLGDHLLAFITGGLAAAAPPSDSKDGNQ
ncbi:MULTISPECIES: TetR/AcrR family transcriptional regulator [unclassified Novosphingobium]|uniref:TetR/AcrR family transcriptional regulator n=1 Tax=unclassified Novosphingobium TaxID=2644732 RepID=UPI0014466897|nr:MULTISPECIES: TetR/AcrR family transcriptional regulator [unclassified Novosphingobium]NKJ45015.1 AcrR family transcriptional regulator [Novosphingobium sp. SG720]NMN07618.1 AcrR family transcriptional regulator [Novosphingobium sp. SG919]NMN89928.1 AcrR family transcriptional regulator [Novosphingobium sp. SG916]